MNTEDTRKHDKFELADQSTNAGLDLMAEHSRDVASTGALANEVPKVADELDENQGPSDVIQILVQRRKLDGRGEYCGAVFGPLMDIASVLAVENNEVLNVGRYCRLYLETRIRKNKASMVRIEKYAEEDTRVNKTTSNVQEFGSKIFLMEDVKWTADVHFVSVLEDDNKNLPRTNVTAFSTSRCIVHEAGCHALMIRTDIIVFQQHGYTTGHKSDWNTSTNLEEIILYSLNYDVLQVFLFPQIEFYVPDIEFYANIRFSRACPKFDMQFLKISSSIAASTTRLQSNGTRLVWTLTVDVADVIAGGGGVVSIRILYRLRRSSVSKSKIRTIRTDVRIIHRLSTSRQVHCECTVFEKNPSFTGCLGSSLMVEINERGTVIGMVARKKQVCFGLFLKRDEDSDLASLPLFKRSQHALFPFVAPNSSLNGILKSAWAPMSIGVGKFDRSTRCPSFLTTTTSSLFKTLTLKKVVQSEQRQGRSVPSPYPWPLQVRLDCSRFPTTLLGFEYMDRRPANKIIVEDVDGRSVLMRGSFGSRTNIEFSGIQTLRSQSHSCKVFFGQTVVDAIERALTFVEAKREASPMDSRFNSCFGVNECYVANAMLEENERLNPTASSLSASNLNITPRTLFRIKNRRKIQVRKQFE
ncbi:hypothetical protein IW262DRAFT_1299209 [Armillaria fumosa]|nr:hypothetical protein IW262DRAFT_1299207 [Armillaria fumosa]KAK0217265.1 hypothetical protein IW262DRAFT_1299209 [Armillaria fumosa]